MSFKIKNNVSWVGATDWELTTFHGEQYSTHHGTSYNAYLIQEEKTVLIDTVWFPFSLDFVENLQKEIDLKKIDAIVVNHGEVDHSGALPELMKHIPEVPIYCTANGVKSLKGQYHQDWNFQVVKTGDKLNIGSKDLVFVEIPMLHWPDSMMTYLTGDNILFSNDAFGQHLAVNPFYNDQVDQSVLEWECTKYYANILTPFSKFVTKKIDEVLAMNLPLDMICPSHGVIWRDKPVQIIEKYQKWADEYQENQITIIYDTMWNGTKMMAEAIAQGIRNQDKDVTIKIYRTSKRDTNDICTEVFKSKAIIVGSSTINNTILPSVAEVMEEIRGLKFRGKKAASFGSYGWSGESPKILTDLLDKTGFSVVNEGLKVNWTPDDEGLKQCIEFGEKFITSL